jgi:hypothetical protein
VLKRLLTWNIAAAVFAALAGCGSSDTGSTPPPANVRATGGDGYIQVTWDMLGGVDYFAFAANDPRLTTTNWLNLPGAAAYVNIIAPLTLCNALNGQEKWIILNGRTGTDPGGPGSPAVSATPRPSGDAWVAGIPMIDPLMGIGFAQATTCRPTGLPSGRFVAVGPAAALYTSPDGSSWSKMTAPLGFTADLFAVANRTSNMNLLPDPGMRTIAVGAGGAALISADGGLTWTVGRSFDAGQPTFRGIIAAEGTYIAVGSGGTIQSTSDGLTWAALASNTSNDLNAIAYGNGRYIAVGNGGTILTSLDGGVTWGAQSMAGVGSLRAIAYGNFNSNTDNGGVTAINSFVAVGDGGMAVVSNDGGLSWNVTGIPGASDLRGIAYTTRFTAVDSSGTAFSSANGTLWNSGVASGQPSFNAVATNGYRLVAVGADGINSASD